MTQIQSFPIDALNQAHRLDCLHDSIHVWMINLRDDTDTSLSGLLDDERKRAERFYFDVHRRRFTVSHRWQTQLLARYLGVPVEAIAYTVAKKGKPSVRVNGQDTALQFNLSHSNDVAMLAVTQDTAIGVDVEYCKPNVSTVQIADRFFTPKEAAWLREHPQDQIDAAFFTLWVRKESIIKATGQGLSQGLNTFNCGAHKTVSEHDVVTPGHPTRSYRCATLWAPQGYKAALAVQFESSHLAKQIEQYQLVFS